MSCIRKMGLLLLCLLLALPLEGCWNYAEIDDYSIVAGVAMDINPGQTGGKYLLTMELVDTKEGGTDKSGPSSQIISLTGDTLFEISRRAISLTGKKLYWSHAKAVILSQEVARDGVRKTIDWLSRDTESRSDTYVFISRQKTAKEILELGTVSGMILSFELALMMRSEKFAGRAPVVEIWDFIDKLESSGYNAVIPQISIHALDKKPREQVEGAALFAEDRLAGFLDGDMTRSMLIVRDQMKAGTLVTRNEQGKPVFTLEIQGNKTRLKPKLTGGKLSMHVEIEMHTNLDEVVDPDIFLKDSDIHGLQKHAGQELQEEVERAIREV